MAETVPDALTAALDFEVQGRKFYLRTAEQASDPLSRKLFQTLAEDELRHQERFQQIFSRIQQGATWPQPAPAHATLVEEEIHGFFAANRETLKPGTTTLEGYEFALRLEKTSIELYSKYARESGSAAERAFYEALIAEERGHLEAIQNVHYFLTQPGDWYQEDESRHWNWMDL